MTDRQHNNHQPELKTASEEEDKDQQEAPSALPQETRDDTTGFGGDGQTNRLLSNSHAVDSSVSTNMTSLHEGSSYGPTIASSLSPSASSIKSTNGGVNVEAAAHSSCSAEAAAGAATTAHLSFSSPAVNDTEMAIVSESMAQASLSPAKASEVRPEGAVVEKLNSSNGESLLACAVRNIALEVRVKLV